MFSRPFVSPASQIRCGMLLSIASACACVTTEDGPAPPPQYDSAVVDGTDEVSTDEASTGEVSMEASSETSETSSETSSDTSSETSASEVAADAGDTATHEAASSDGEP